MFDGNGMNPGLPVPFLTIDVAHPPRHPADVEAELLHALNEVRHSSSLRILKIIHGYGSSGKGGNTKATVRNWLFLNKGKFIRVIDGEEYNVYNEFVQEMRTRVGMYDDGDLRSGNAGISVVWVKE